MSTISTTINHGVTLGQPNYDSPLTVTSTGYVSNNGSGQAIYGSTGTVVNQGTLVATGASVFGKYSGIEIYGNGNAYNSGTIIAASNGIAIYAVGSVTNSGGISAQQWGVVGRGSFLDVSNTGTIYGADNGINLFSGGSVTNSGTIIGDNGVAISGDAGTVVNSGGITGTYQNGIALEVGGSVTNSAGGVIYSGGPYAGVYVAGGPGTILNSGTIDGSTGARFGIYFGTFNDTLIDSGTIIGRGGTAVAFDGGTDRMQLLPGNLLIQGTVNGGGETSTLEFTSGASAGTLTGVGASFTNFGIGTVDAGASWVLAGNVTLGIGMTLANDSALTLAASGTLVNTGSITADLTSESIRGGGTAALLDNLGSIQAYNIGVDLQLGGTLINGASGNATALINANYGAFAASGLVSNYGTIFASGSGSESVLLGGAGQVTNHVGGLITGYNVGVDLSGGVATLINLGVVSAANNGALALYNDDVLINGAGGLIAGTRAVVMATAVTTPVSDTLNNYGTITGQYGVIIGILPTTGTLHATIVDAGTIIGTGGTAIEALAAGPSQSIDLTLRLLAGNDFIQGTVAGYAGGTGVLDFASGSGTGTLTGSGADFINFQTASVDAGANWTFAGTNTLGANTTLVDAGLLTNIGTLVVDPPITVTGIFVNGSIVSAPGTYTAFSIASGGVLTNSTAGTITAGGDGAYGNTGTVVNQGSISAGNVGVLFSAAGTVSNASGATIAATNAGIVINGAGTVVNQGTIAGTDPAGLGVDLTAGGTVVDSGLISGGADAIKFGGSSNLLVLENGYALSGAVYGASGASNTLELLGTSAANAVTATYNTLGLTNFGTIAFAPGAGNYATLRITNDATLPGTIAGFTGVHDTIDLTTLAFVSGSSSAAFNTASDQITVSNGTNSVALQLGAGIYSGFTAVSDGAAGTDVIVGPTVLSYDWVGPSADWRTAPDWSSGVVPGTTASATIGNAGSNTVTISNTESIQVASLALSNSNTLDVAGTLSPTGAISIADALLSVSAGGLITHGGSGTLIQGTGVVDNSGTITSGGIHYGINLTGTVSNQGSIGATVRATTIVNRGTISNTTANATGVISTNGSFADVINGTSGATNALIDGANTGVRLIGGNSGGTVVNYGTVIGTNFVGVDLSASAGTVGLSNYGTILAGGSNFAYAAVHVGSAATINNTGVIEETAAGALGVYARSNGGVTNIGLNLNNSGLITAISRAVEVNSYIPAVVTNSGTLIGSEAFVVFSTGATSQTLMDSGTIIGTSGTAVEFGTGNDLLQFQPSGSVFVQGTVDGAGGTNTLEFASSSGIGTLTGSNAEFVNFGNGTVDAGANWVLAGGITFASSVTLANSGTLTDSGTLINGGTITGLAPDVPQLELAPGGYLLNQATGVITQTNGFGVYGLVSGASTVTNLGTIAGYGGIGIGVYLKGGGTVIDSGTIAGATTAVAFGGTGSNLLILEHGYALNGGVAGSASATNTVELLGTSAANAVTATYNTLGLTNVGTAAFAPGAGNYATLRITDDATLPGTLAGFTGVHDTIDLTGLSDAGNDATTSFDTLTNVLTVTGDDGSVQLQLDSEDYTGVAWQALNDGSNGTDVTPLCFCAGTVIATPEGDVPVERLGAGDLVVTMSGQVRPIAWIGTGRVLATRGRRNAATPVIVRKGSIAPNVPHSDLHVTKGHSLYLDGVLVPVEFLVNHRTILWDDHAQEVTLYHVELETHDVLLANGAPAESYRDDGNRWLFQNANAGWDQAPRPPCAEVLTGGPIVDAVWRRLLERAGPRPRQVLTDDPDLHVLVDGCRVDAARRTDAAYVFSLPVAVRSVRIASRAAAPAELGVARDPRVLGVALRRIVVRAGSRFRVVDLTDEHLVEGFHGYESDGALRWTDGDAVLPVDFFRSFAGRTELVLHVDGATQYRADDRSDRCVA